MKYGIALVLIGCGSGFSTTNLPSSDSGPDAPTGTGGSSGPSSGGTRAIHGTGGKTETGGASSGTGGTSGSTGGASGSSGGRSGGSSGDSGPPCDPATCPALADGTTCPGSLAAPTATSCCTAGSCGCWGESMQAGQPEVDVCYPANTCTPSGANDNLCPASAVYMFTCPGVDAPDPSCQLFGVASYGRPYFCCPKPSYGMGSGGTGGTGGGGTGGTTSSGGTPSTGGALSCSQAGSSCAFTCCPGTVCLLNGICQACFPVGVSCGFQAQFCCSQHCSTSGICVP